MHNLNNKCYNICKKRKHTSECGRVADITKEKSNNNNMSKVPSTSTLSVENNNNNNKTHNKQTSTMISLPRPSSFGPELSVNSHSNLSVTKSTSQPMNKNIKRKKNQRNISAVTITEVTELTELRNGKQLESTQLILEYNENSKSNNEERKSQLVPDASWDMDADDNNITQISMNNIK